VLGRPLAAAERERFDAYLALLARWDQTHDLTGCKGPRDMVTGLFRDSLLFGGMLPAGAVRVVDIGAGAGIPGLPLHLVFPRLRITLIEARRKRVSFLRAAMRELHLDVEVAEGRAETLIEERPEFVQAFDVVVSRGVPIDALLTAANPYLKAGGSLIAGGPPAPGALPPAPGYTSMSWNRKGYPALGLTRTFLVATK
jgi:16S rRNA (guanine527-N7)-methyltransferase